MPPHYRDFAGPHKPDKRKSDKYFWSSADLDNFHPVPEELPRPRSDEINLFFEEFTRLFGGLRRVWQQAALNVFKTHNVGVTVQVSKKPKREELSLQFTFEKGDPDRNKEKIILVLEGLHKSQTLILPAISQFNRSKIAPKTNAAKPAA